MSNDATATATALDVLIEKFSIVADLIPGGAEEPSLWGTDQDLKDYRVKLSRGGTAGRTFPPLHFDYFTGTGVTFDQQDLTRSAIASLIMDIDLFRDGPDRFGECFDDVATAIRSWEYLRGVVQRFEDFFGDDIDALREAASEY